jgi:hypothetical protein
LLVGLTGDNHEAVIHLPETLGNRESFARFRRPMDFPIDDLVEIQINPGENHRDSWERRIPDGAKPREYVRRGMRGCPLVWNGSFFKK